MTAIPARPLHYAWIIAAVTFVVVLLTAGVRAAPGILIVPLEEEFHWSRATISFAVGVNLLLYGLVGPFAAALMDRFGVRRTMTLALAAIAAGVALSPLMQEPWQLVLLWGVAVGIGCGFIGAYLGPFIAVRWFHQRQGVVIGVLTAANAAGQLVFLPTMAALTCSILKTTKRVFASSSRSCRRYPRSICAGRFAAARASPLCKRASRSSFFSTSICPIFTAAKFSSLCRRSPRPKAFPLS